jgi:trk system potassium uptake protein TrkA
MNVIIVGAGQVGDYLASLLIERGHKVTIIEQREARLAALKRDLPEDSIVLGNGTDPKVLEAAGIRSADVLAAVTGADETNLVIATLARFEFNVRRVVARVNNPRNNWLFNPTMGVDLGVNQADLMAHVVAEEMSMGDMMTLLKLHRGQFSLVERKVDPASAAIDVKLKDLNLPLECVLVAVIRDANLMLPRGDTQLAAGDDVMAIVHDSNLEQLAAILGPSK